MWVCLSLLNLSLNRDSGTERDGAIEKSRRTRPTVKVRGKIQPWPLKWRCVDWHPLSALTWLVSLSLSLQSYSAIQVVRHATTTTKTYCHRLLVYTDHEVDSSRVVNVTVPKKKRGGKRRDPLDDRAVANDRVSILFFFFWSERHKVIDREKEKERRKKQEKHVCIRRHRK